MYRYDERNNHCQCVACNVFKKGNLTVYALRLIKIYGTKLLEELKGHENVLSIMESDGKYDLLVIFASKNPSSFNKKLKILVSDYPQLKDWMILTSVVDHHYLRNYLLGKGGLV